jgi:hypothetical protein
VHLIDDDVEDPPALVVIEPRDLAGDPERRDPADAGSNEEVDDAPQAVFVDVSVRLERGGKD